MASGQPPFPSTVAPSTFFAIPSFNSHIVDPTQGVNQPWNYYLTFNGARSAAVGPLQGNVTDLQAAVGVLQGQVTTLQGQIVTIQGQITALQAQVNTNTTNITTLQGQVSTLQGQVATIQGQILALQAEDINLQNQINVIDRIFASQLVGALPPAATNTGRRTFVTDALGPAFGVAVVGGGAVFVPVYCNGTTWLVG